MSDKLDKVSIERAIADSGRYVSTTSGSSMKPMLRNRRDTVVICKNLERVKKYDVILYRTDDGCVLHRVVKVLSDSYVLCGDNRIVLEKGIRDEDIIGVLTEVFRGEKKVRLDGFGYLVYSRYIVATFYPRRFFRLFRSFLSRKVRKASGKSKT